ncbi:DNA methyltransferase [Yersinia enterocolitica]|nr:hypothetical protein [Escherichia coli]
MATTSYCDGRASTAHRRRPFRQGHFAAFPDNLMTSCILAGSRVVENILDSFMGSGMTVAAAFSLQRHFT